jgi:hypothetical protein
MYAIELSRSETTVATPAPTTPSPALKMSTGSRMIWKMFAKALVHVTVHVTGGRGDEWVGG